MKMFEIMKQYSHAQLTACYDKSSDLKAFIAIHTTELGPIVGGCRMWNYGSADEALADALKLSMDMTRRAAVSGCDLSGGSVVIWGNPKSEKSEVLFRALGRFIDAFEGRFIITSELGTDSNDLEDMRRETPYVVDLPSITNAAGEEALATAWGVYFGIMVCVREVFKATTLKGLHIAIDGVGKLGSSLAELLKKKEPQISLSICDIDYDRMKMIQDRYPEVNIVSPDEMLKKEYDVLVPCSQGSILTPESVNDLRCKIIAGGATCTLSDENVAELIHQRGILMAPDFVINTGGVIQAERALKDVQKVVTEETFRKVALNLVRIFAQSREEGRSPYAVALQNAEDRFEKVARVRQILSTR